MCFKIFFKKCKRNLKTLPNLSIAIHLASSRSGISLRQFDSREHIDAKFNDNECK